MSFVNLTSDFMKLVQIPGTKKPTYIDFTATDFVTMRASLIDYIKAVYPLDYTHFVESDLGMMFIELVAYMGAVNSMKADMLANENFLATAKNRTSVKKLFELIGVRMKGPLSAAADAKITLDTSTTGYVIGPEARVINITSPEDGAPLTFTIYKVINGLVADANAAASVILVSSEAINAALTVYTNIVLQEGALVVDSGNFISTEGVKSVKLSQSPVVEGSVEVVITSQNTAIAGAYNSVDSLFFASSTSDKVFEVVYDENYAATVVFGDNVNGVSPEQNAAYTIIYRVGGGSRGNITSNYINSTVAGSDGVTTINSTITNTSVATGGSNAETVEHAKKWAPLTFSRQNRCVTLADYTVWANNYISTYGTVGKAIAATRKAYCSANIIDIYVLEKASDLQLQKATSEFKSQLLTAVQTQKMVTDEIVVVDGLIRTLDLVINVRVDKELEKHEEVVKNKVRDKVLTYMNVDNIDFGQALILADLNRSIFELDEVRYSSVDNLSDNITVDFNEIIQLNNLTIVLSYLD